MITLSNILFSERYSKARNLTIACSLVLSFIVMIVTSTDPILTNLACLESILCHENNTIFSLAAGIVVSSIFYFIMVYIPEESQKYKAYKSLLPLVTFIIEAKDSSPFHWSKNVYFCDTNKVTLEQIKSLQQQIDGKTLNSLQIKFILEACSEATHLFDGARPIAAMISPEHFRCWTGLSHSIFQLSEVYSKLSQALEKINAPYGTENDHEQTAAINSIHEGIKDEFFLYFDELLKILINFMELKGITI